MIEPIARIRIELQGVAPKIWRRVDVPLSATLLALHDIVQITFRWTDPHLFEFKVGGRIYGEPENDLFSERRIYKAASVGARHGVLVPARPTRTGCGCWISDIPVLHLGEDLLVPVRPATWDDPVFVDRRRW